MVARAERGGHCQGGKGSDHTQPGAQRVRGVGSLSRARGRPPAIGTGRSPAPSRKALCLQMTAVPREPPEAVPLPGGGLGRKGCDTGPPDSRRCWRRGLGRRGFHVCHCAHLGTLSPLRSTPSERVSCSFRNTEATPTRLALRAAGPAVDSDRQTGWLHVKLEWAGVSVGRG